MFLLFNIYILIGFSGAKESNPNELNTEAQRKKTAEKKEKFTDTRTVSPSKQLTSFSVIISFYLSPERESPEEEECGRGRKDQREPKSLQFNTVKIFLRNTYK